MVLFKNTRLSRKRARGGSKIARYLRKRRRLAAPVRAGGKLALSTRRRNNVVFGLGFPKKLNFTHRYVQRGTFTCTAGAYQKLDFSANDMFLVASGGHQPLYFDQIGALYNQFTVIGSKAQVKFMFTNPQTDSAGSTVTPLLCPTECGVFINDDTTTTPTNVFFLQEQGDLKKAFLGPGTDAVKTCTMGWSAKKYAGTGLISNPNWIGNTTTSPAEKYYFTVFAQPLDLTTAVTISYVMQIDFTAVWTEPKDIANS